MSYNLKQFQQKVANRKQGLASTNGSVKQTILEKPCTVSEVQKQWEMLRSNLAEADVCKYNNDGYFPIYSHRKHFGTFVVFVKKAVRKLIRHLLGWYLFPIYQRQSHFNGKILNAVSIEKDIVLGLEANIKELQTSNDQLLQGLESLKTDNGQLLQEIESLKTDNSQLLQEIKQHEVDVVTLKEQLFKLGNLPTTDDEFYHQFEERFRGSREEIKGRLQVYVPIVKKQLPDWSQCRFIDVGSGRGEWLDILKDNGAADYVGVDLNAKQNRICEDFGHQTHCADCIEYLTAQPDESVDMISGFQIIEHLCMSDLMELLKQAHRILKKGGVLLFETQNPRNIVVGADTFYIDPSHRRPMDPEMTKFLAKWTGFENVRCIDANSHPEESNRVPLPDVNDKNYTLIKQFNDIKWLLYGPMDYALFAVKE